MSQHAGQQPVPSANLTRRAFAVAAGSAAAHLLAACSQGQQGGTAPISQDAPAGEGEVDAPADVALPASARTSLFSVATLSAERAVTPQAQSYQIEDGLSNVDVPTDLYLSDELRAMIASQGFGVQRGWSDEFYPIYEDNRYNLRPNLVTVDSLMHSYHLYFEYLLKKTESGTLSQALTRMSAALVEATSQQLSALAGTEWESAARRALAFFAVGNQLIDPSATAPAEVADVVSQEIGSIMAAGGTQASAVTGLPLDYSQFIVRGYYEQTEALQRYFRTMMWYGQLSFIQKEEDLDRTALLMTLALDEAALEDWQAIYAATSFFVGAADDNGYYEYLPALEEVYGEGVSASDLPGNDEAWQRFHALTAQMPTPQINSIPGSSASNNEEDRGFRLMGQRFTIDAHIFQQLVFDNVGETSSGSKRLLPDALDVPAALGSKVAYDILSQPPQGGDGPYGSTQYPGYDDNLADLKEQVAAKGDDFWQASLYNQWLHTLRPLLETKEAGYPSFMQGDTWALHGLESFLGSYTELKHDTILYAKQSAAEGDGPIIQERDDRGYVEAEPLVFNRLERLCSATMQGLAHFGLIDATDFGDLDILRQLADQLSTIAAKELADELPTDEEFELIRSIGEQLEHFWEQVHKEDSERTGLALSPMQFPSSVVADVATGDSSCLELGTGKVSRLFAVVPVDGTLKLASGPVFTFHEFAWPTSDRLTDTAWREMIMKSYMEPNEATEIEPWTRAYRTEN